MTRWKRSLGIWLAIAVTAAAAPDESRPGPPHGGLVIHWHDSEGGRPSAVEVEGIAPADLAALSALSRSEPPSFHWSRVFPVIVVTGDQAAGGEERPAILGTYRVIDARLRFEPRFPFEPGLKYRATFRPSRLPLESYRSFKDITTEFTRPLPPPPPPTSVVRVDPAGERLPENLLKFYLHFSAPMSRGEAYKRVTLRDAAGRPLEVPFLELGEELWDPSGTRLTLLLDPGRIKRGLKPREDLGPILESGRGYTLVVSREWPDATGHPLRESYRKSFRAGPADEVQPDPKTWKVAPPTADEVGPLSLTFPEPLDQAMLRRALTVLNPLGQEVAGQVEVDVSATRWSFRPARPWLTGRYQLVVDTSLEDLVGNSIARPFEVDIQGPITPRIESATTSIPFEVRAKRLP